MINNMSNKLLISVIIPYHNKYTRLVRVLDGLDKQTIGKDSFEVIVVDDGSQIELSKCDEIKEYDKKINLTIVRIENSGRSKARNKGIEHAKAEIVAFLDDDVILPDIFLERHIHYHTGFEKIFVHSSILDDYQMYFEDRHPATRVANRAKMQEKLHRINQHLRKAPIAETLCKLIYTEEMMLRLDWVGCMASNLSILKHNIISEGMFSDQFSSWGCEDFELGYRLCLKGYKLIYDDLVLIHSPHNIRTAESIHTSFQKFYSIYQDIRIQLVKQYFLGEITPSTLIDDLKKLS